MNLQVRFVHPYSQSAQLRIKATSSSLTGVRIIVSLFTTGEDIINEEPVSCAGHIRYMYETHTVHVLVTYSGCSGHL